MGIYIYILFLIYAINLAFWLYLLLGFPKHDPTDKNNVQPKVSIVISALNEELNLRVLIPLLLKLNYPDYEIIVIDDGSEDGTLGLLKSVVDNRFRFETIKNTKPGKRDALKLGVALCEGEYIILTDADCRPNSADWISATMANMAGNDIGLLYGPILKERGFLNALVRYETMVTAVQYFTFAAKAKPYMGVGRNIIYKSSVLQGNTWNESTLAGGDDDLTFQQLAKGRKVTWTINPTTWMYSKGPSTYKSWSEQKTRHVLTSFEYSWKMKIILGIFGATQVLWPIFLMVLLNENMSLAFFLYSIRLMILVLIGRPVWRRLGGEKEWALIPILDLFLSIYFFVVLFLSFFRNKSNW